MDRATWEWSRTHALSLFVTHPLALVAGAYLAITRSFRPKIAGAIQAASSQRLEQLERDGKPVARERCAGKIGPLTGSGPVIGVAVFHNGIRIKPVFMEAHVILASEIRAVKRVKEFLGDETITIEHAGVDLASPVKLYLSGRSQVAKAISQLEIGGPGVPDVQREPADGGYSFGKLLEVVSGVVGGLIILFIGLVWAVPDLGVIGIAWTAFASFLIAWNIRAGWRAWSTRNTRRDQT